MVVERIERTWPETVGNFEELGELVERVIGTYDLNDSRKTKIFLRVVEDLEQRKVYDLAGIYERISDMVACGQIPYKERGSGVSLNDAFMGEGTNLVNNFLVEEKGDENGEISYVELPLKEALTRLNGAITPSTRENLSQLAGGLDRLIKVSEEFLEDPESGEVVNERVSKVVKRFKRRDKSSFPEKPIKSASFNGDLKIVFGSRDFKGDPLSYFIRNREFYKDVGGRRQLFDFDSSLYYSLLNHGQLDEAIPEKKNDKYRGHESPLAYFKANEELKFKGKSRSEISRIDPGLHYSLLKHDQLDEARPEDGRKNVKFRGFSGPLEYVAHNKEEVLARTKGFLSRDKSLQASLKKRGQIEEAKKLLGITNPYRGHGSALAYVMANNTKYEGFSKGNLRRADESLYKTLRRHNQIDEAVTFLNSG